MRTGLVTPTVVPWAEVCEAVLKRNKPCTSIQGSGKFQPMDEYWGFKAALLKNEGYVWMITFQEALSQVCYDISQHST